MANTVITFNNNAEKTENVKSIANKEIYKDISLVSNYGTKIHSINHSDPSKNAGYKVSRSVNVKAVSNAVHNIFSFFPGERVLFPEFGSKLKIHLYNGITYFNQERIVAEIYASLEQFDQRVVVDDIVIVTSDKDKDDNTVVLRIFYHIEGLPDSHYHYDYSYVTGD